MRVMENHAHGIDHDVDDTLFIEEGASGQDFHQQGRRDTS